MRTLVLVLQAVPAQVTAIHSTLLQSWERNGTTEHSFYQLAYLGHNLGAHPPLSYHSRHAG